MCPNPVVPDGTFFVGKEALSFSLAKKQSTYTRTYSASEDANQIRIVLGCSDLDMERIGQISSVSFNTFKYENLANMHLSPACYALCLYGEKIQRISQLDLKTLCDQADAYSINYIIHHYFEAVTHPQEEDLVVYSKPDNNIQFYPLVGIFMAEYNGKAVLGGTVLAKYDSYSPYVFQFPLFFTPFFYGDEATFYRLKTEPVLFLTYSLSSSLPEQKVIQSVVQKDYFTYHRSNYTEFLRDSIDLTRCANMHQFPQITPLNYIKFNGICFQYAFGKILGIYRAPNDILHAINNKADILKKYFDTTLYPETGDMAVYYDPNHNPLHYGIYLSETRIISKWGGNPIYEHPYFDVPKQYGHILKCLKLKLGLTKKRLYENLRLDEECLLEKKPIEKAVILNDDNLGNRTLLLFSYKKPSPPKPHPRKEIHTLLGASPSKTRPKF